MTDFKGVIIEESLANSSVLQDVVIESTKVEKVTKKHSTPWLKQWRLHTVVIPANSADVVAEKISQSLDLKHPWYADFKNNSTHYIVFRGKVFKVNRSKPKQYQAATEYGISLGIPAYQVDFSSHIKEWKR